MRIFLALVFLLTQTVSAKFTDKTDRLEVVTPSDIQDAGEQKFEMIKNKPEVRFKKWDGEVDLGLTYTGIDVSGGLSQDTEKMEYKDTKQEVHMYPLEAGFELEVVLLEKPDTNVVFFTLSNYQNLDFFYQPELTQAQIDKGVIRPENVVGSYAVYHKTKKDHIQGQTNYGVGKVGHIYRPRIVDSDGNEAWGVLDISGGVLSVTIPQKFLDDAVYPVKHAAGLTFGTTGIGGTQDQIENTIQGSFYTGAVGTGVSMTTYVKDDGAAPAHTIACRLYNSTSSLTTNGATDTLLLTSTVAGWQTMNFTVAPTLAAQSYILAVWANSAEFGAFSYMDAGAADSGAEDFNSSFPTWPTGGFSLDTDVHSIYVTYTVAGAAVDNPRQVLIVE